MRGGVRARSCSWSCLIRGHATYGLDAVSRRLRVIETAFFSADCAPSRPRSCVAAHAQHLQDVNRRAPDTSIGADFRPPRRGLRCCATLRNSGLRRALRHRREKSRLRPPMTGAASPNRLGGAHGGVNQHGCARRWSRWRSVSGGESALRRVQYASGAGRRMPSGSQPSLPMCCQGWLVVRRRSREPDQAISRCDDRVAMRPLWHFRVEPGFGLALLRLVTRDAGGVVAGNAAAYRAFLIERIVYGRRLLMITC